MKPFALMVTCAFICNLALANPTVKLGMSEEQLLKIVDAKKVSGMDGHQHGYSDFTEVNPVVYVDTSSSARKLEYYFHEGKLYKIYTIYRDQSDVSNLYQKKFNELAARLGEPKRQYTSEYFSMPIQHNVWDMGNEELDLRFGAGYVYEVLVNKPAALEKKKQLEMEYAI